MNERLKNFVWIIVVIVAFTVFSMLHSGTSTYLDFGEETLSITAPENYTYDVEYDEVVPCFELRK